jgi:hypothetical protein
MKLELRRPVATGFFFAAAVLFLAGPGTASPERPPPPGKFIGKPAASDPSGAAGKSFRRDQPVVGTYYFYWYDSDTGEHFVDPDGTDALTDHPLDPRDTRYRSSDWHHRQLLDVLAAGLDFVLPVYWGYPGDYQSWSFAGLPPLVEACRRLEKEGKVPPRIGLFYDTSTLQHNRRNFHADLSTPEGQEWLYLSARDFYSLVPPDLRAAIEGRPLVWLYSATFARRKDPRALDYLRREFEADFGVEPFVVKEVSWTGRADATYAWGAALRPSVLGVAAVGPGYDHSAVPGRSPLVRDREGGAFYSRSWDLVLSRDPATRPSIAIVETFNEFHEGTEIAATREYGRAYLDLTARYAALWHQGKRLERKGPFARAGEVSVILGEKNREDGLCQKDEPDGRTRGLASAPKTARSTDPARGGKYLYFDVEDSFFFGGGGPLEVVFEYLDRGRGAVVLEYDSLDFSVAPLEGSFKPVPAASLGNEGLWKTARVRLEDAAFGGRANGSDFRLSAPGGELAIHRVLVRRLDPGPPAGSRAGSLVLAEGGRTDFTIFIAADASEPERHAAGELARFLEEMSGTKFPVEAAEGPPRAGASWIAVGPGAARGTVSPEEISRLGGEGYLLRTKGKGIAIAGGRPRGTLYGVYSFLEEELGCRWFTPDVSRIPRRTRVEVPKLERLFIPALELRSTDYPHSRDADWAARNKLNGTQTALDARRGGKISYGPFVHTFNSILDPAQHFEKHPEYFSEVNGKRIREHTQLCVTNPEVLRIAIETVRRWMREQPEASIFSVSQNDWQNWCTCRECSRVIGEEGSPMGPYLRFVNAIAGAMEEEFPGKSIDTLAYQFTRRPPAKTVPRPNVIVRLCSIECCFSHPLSSPAAQDPRNAAFASDLRGWSEVSRRLYLWDYVIDYPIPSFPSPTSTSSGRTSTSSCGTG